MGLGAHVLSSSRRIRLVSRMLRLEQSRVSTSEGGGQLCADAATTDYFALSVLWARD